MANPGLLWLALAVLAGGVFVSALLSGSLGAADGVGGADDHEGNVALDSLTVPDGGSDSSVILDDKRDARSTGGNEPASSTVGQFRDPVDLRAYIDPDARPVSISAGIGSDAGHFEDPDYDLPPPLWDEVISHVGEYIDPDAQP